MTITTDTTISINLAPDTDLKWTPKLRDGQALLFETEGGFKGHVRLGERVFRVFVTKTDIEGDAHRLLCVIDGTAPDGAAITGRLLFNPDEAACLRDHRPAPVLQGHVHCAECPDKHFEFVAWLRHSQNGGRHVSGVVKSADSPVI